MAVLGLKQVQAILQKPENKQVIQRAAALQQRIRFHTEPALTLLSGPRTQNKVPVVAPATTFLNWVKEFLPKDKYNIFLQLFKFPLVTSAIAEDVYTELERVFNSRNSSAVYHFTAPEFADDWKAYQNDRLNEPEVWKVEGWKKMQISPNSVLVVDLPRVQSSSRPEPYFYWLEIEDVIDFELDTNGKLNWIVFNQGPNKVAAFDSEQIAVYNLNDKRLISSIDTIAIHNLGYCPAQFFWSDYLSSNDSRAIKRNPIVKKLSDLDWYLFFALSKRHLDLYAPYPIYSAYEADCNFENNETGDYCDGGFLRNSAGEFKMLADGSVERCPCCSEKRIAGPGSFLEVPIPNQVEGIADMRNPVQITTIDRESLDYNVKELERLKNEIITSIVGSGGSVSEKEAINETQVAANFESKTSVLNALKKNFEEAQRFVDDTICRLRYGSDFISSAISWGTEFYVFTVQELYSKYDQAKRAGASEAELSAITQQILEVEYRNNPLTLQRMILLKQLEPYPHKTLEEVLKLTEKGLLNEKMVQLKINFSTLVEKFERENINLLEFASNRPLREKVDIIQNKLLEYLSDEKFRPTTSTDPERTSGVSGTAATA